MSGRLITSLFSLIFFGGIGYGLLSMTPTQEQTAKRVREYQKKNRRDEFGLLKKD